MDWELLPIREFRQWSNQWQLLNEQLANNLPVLQPEFISALIDNFSDGNELLAIGKTDKETVAMGIFCQNSPYSWQTFQPSQAPVGLWLCPENKLIKALENLTKKLPGFVLKLDILQQDPDISPPVPEKTKRFEIIDYIQTSQLIINQDFDTYFASLGKNQRQNYNKANNRLAKQSTIVGLEIVISAQNMFQSIKEYGEIESNSWKDTLGTAININNQQGKFYHQVMTEFAEAQNAQVWKYFYDQKLVAIDLCIKNDEQLIILKTTFDSDYSRFSPAINMKLDALKPVFNDRLVQRIEFFGKTLQWHKRLNSIGRTMYHFSFYRYNPLLQIKRLIAQFKKQN